MTDASTKVANVTEAIALAEDWKRGKRFDWFRGQINSAWPLLPSFQRRQGSARDEAVRLQGRYFGWIDRTAGVEYLASNDVAAKAVAQHYGIPTTYLDFTTEPRVAAFFASHDPEAPALGTESCIVCLNTVAFEDACRNVRSVEPNRPVPSLHRVDVGNLWRLQAQHGIFLQVPYAEGLDPFYSVDRIVFPYSGPVEQPPVTAIYPDRKSALEILLDQFFANEGALAGTAWLKSLFDSLDIPADRKAWVEYEALPDFVASEVRTPLLPLRSWAEMEDGRWLRSDAERWHDVSAGPTWRLPVRLERAPRRLMNDLVAELEQLLEAQPDARRSLVDWQFDLNGADRSESAQVDRLRQVTRRVWDGVRSLPFSVAEVARAVAGTIALESTRLASRSGDDRAAHAMFFDEPMRLELDGGDGSNSRCWVSASDLRRATRGDLSDVLKRDLPENPSAYMRLVLQIVSNPRFLFRFQDLRRLWVEQFVPSMVVTYGEHHVFFSPARAYRIGLP